MKPIKAETNEEKKDGKSIFNPLVVFNSRNHKDKIMKEKICWLMPLFGMQMQVWFFNKNLRKI